MLTFYSDTWFISVGKLLHSHLPIYLIKKKKKKNLGPIGPSWYNNPHKIFFWLPSQWQSPENDINILSRGQWPGRSFFQLWEVPNFLVPLLVTFHQVSTTWGNMELAEGTGRGNFWKHITDCFVKTLPSPTDGPSKTQRSQLLWVMPVPSDTRRLEWEDF